MEEGYVNKDRNLMGWITEFQWTMGALAHFHNYSCDSCNYFDNDFTNIFKLL